MIAVVPCAVGLFLRTLAGRLRLSLLCKRQSHCVTLLLNFAFPPIRGLHHEDCYSCVDLSCLVLSVTAAADDRTAEPFNGKDLSGWNVKGKPADSYWKVGGAKLQPDDPAKFVVASGTELINDKGNTDRGRGIDIYSELQHGTGRIEIEVMVPKGSNSGVYVQGE